MIDVIIPCYNAADTVRRAVESALAQPECSKVWLVDDASTDHTAAEIAALAAADERMQAVYLPQNGGVAAARNHAARLSRAPLLAFLDADDEYEARVLEAAAVALTQHAHLGVCRLKMRPLNLPEHYAEADGFQTAWQTFEMTAGGNMVVRRSLFLAAGGFPEHELFRRLGGEDGALGIALTRACVVGTLFGRDEAAVRHYLRPQSHAFRLLDAMLFGQNATQLGAAELAEAEAVSAEIAVSLTALRDCLAVPQSGICTLTPER